MAGFWWYFQNGNVSAFGPTRFVRACPTPKERKPPWQEALFLMRLEFLTNLRIASLDIWGLDTTTLTPRSARQSRIVAYLFYLLTYLSGATTALRSWPASGVSETAHGLAPFKKKHTS